MVNIIVENSLYPDVLGLQMVEKSRLLRDRISVMRARLVFLIILLLSLWSIHGLPKLDLKFCEHRTRKHTHPTEFECREGFVGQWINSQKFAKLVEGIPDNIVNCTVLAPLGWIRVQSYIAIRKIIFLWQLLYLPTHSIYKRIVIHILGSIPSEFWILMLFFMSFEIIRTFT